MAKFRQNHNRSRKRPFAGIIIRLFLLFGIIAVLFIAIYGFLDNPPVEWTTTNDPLGNLDSSIFSSGRNDVEVVHHDYYTLGYSEKEEQALWATYKLTRESLRIPNVPRTDRFETDPYVSTSSARHSDYSGSGYSRGHLVPAGDMAFNGDAMSQSFYMSNMSPQLSGFNGGVWRELEECVRDWAYKDEELYITTGPVFNGVTKYIGRQSKVRVPDGFYKVIIDLKGKKKGIGFIVPHEVTKKPLSTFAVTIDQVESATGLDFFNNLYASNSEEERIENQLNINQWKISDKRYQTRIRHWNNN